MSLNASQVIQICKQYKILSSFKRNHRRYYDRARKLGVFKEATAHMLRGVVLPEEIEKEKQEMAKRNVFLLQHHWTFKSDAPELEENNGL